MLILITSLGILISCGNPKKIHDFIIIGGGMSGIGAKGSLAYGLFASNLLRNKDDSARMYQKTKAALGVRRLIEDIKILNKDVEEIK